MGDFDRHQSPSTSTAKEKKKLLVVGVLGSAFLGILGFHLLKGPQIALAKEGGDSGASARAAASEETPGQALAALDPARDPTSNLLLGTVALPPNLTEVPRDPFKISDQWRAMLLKPTEPVRVEPLRVERHAQPDVAPLQPLKPESFKLSGIFHNDQHLYAIVNGSIVSAGMTVGNARVVDIHDDRVVLQAADAPEGPTTTLNIQGKLP